MHAVCWWYISAHGMCTKTTLWLSNFLNSNHQATRHSCTLTTWTALMGSLRRIWRSENIWKTHNTCLRLTYFTFTLPAYPQNIVHEHCNSTGSPTGLWPCFSWVTRVPCTSLPVFFPCRQTVYTCEGSCDYGQRRNAVSRDRRMGETTRSLRALNINMIVTLLKLLSYFFSFI